MSITKADTVFAEEDTAIVRELNSCLDMQKLKEKWKDDARWNRFIELLNLGHVVFSGDPTGFHLEDHHGVLDCGVPPVTENNLEKNKL